jgi:hypothetical protein
MAGELTDAPCIGGLDRVGLGAPVPANASASEVRQMSRVRTS